MQHLEGLDQRIAGGSEEFSDNQHNQATVGSWDGIECIPFQKIIHPHIQFCFVRRKSEIHRPAGAFAELDSVVGKGAPSEKFIKFVDDVFGLKILESTPDIADELKEKIAKRFEAKKAKDFETADAIRAELEAKGIILNDTREGTVWDFKALYSVQ